MELWRDIAGYEGQYKVSDMGRVLAVRRLDAAGRQRQAKVLRPGTKGPGYQIVGLPGNDVRLVHRLVAEAFVPNPYGLPQINHRNLVKDDNRASNIEWCTQLQNIRHAIANGVRIGPVAWQTEEGRKEVARRHYNGHREECLAYTADYYQRNKDSISDYKKQWFQENKGRVRAQQRGYHQNNKWQRKAYYQRNRERMLAYQKAYRERKKEEQCSK